ncbi:hypothetical protein [Vibrio sp. SCSIO 43136]|uniref:hypothetical protein n=1 Tax=Vibrio sp. SCSIO 43136 TaxID=2819101 RepID=UPI0020752C6E|nr:hypothetical protein [Vibrio sp. SCSIO 43136]USD64200.1 hypothetical protein J4N39_08760 [Vibrio sp. SCSIO 43136]
MAQDKEERKKAIAKARKAHHASMIADKKRVDAYVDQSTKDGLKQLKSMFGDVKNEGQAIDKAVQLALESLRKDR